MTIPAERRQAILSVRRFLFDLLDPKKTPGLSREIRNQVRQLLKHYPSDFDLPELK